VALGALIGWLYGKPRIGGRRQTVENLRLQLDEVVKERDQAGPACESASRELAALQADARNSISG
jgi:DNA recombination protein RmuC